MLSAGPIPHNNIHFLIITGYVVFIITSFLAGVKSEDQCLLNFKILSCFSGVIMSIRSFFLCSLSLCIFNWTCLRAYFTHLFVNELFILFTEILKTMSQ